MIHRRNIVMSVQSDAKKTYSKPALKTIDLASEEVLSSGCKTEDGSGGIGDVCVPGAGPCSTGTGS